MDSIHVPSTSALLGVFGLLYASGNASCQRGHNPVRVRNSMKYASCSIGVAALPDSQRTCTRPPAVCTPAHDISISSSWRCFRFDSPIG
jgi:hypothetical protein